MKKTLVFSYIRFSSRKQAKGDSLRRQTELALAWCEKRGYTLADLSYQDCGVSAFRGKNKHKGMLGAFRKAVERGEIPKGSVLLVENLDRLSRQGIYDALELFLSLLNAGIKIAVLQPSEQIYDRSKSDDLIGLLLPLVYFYLAHVESKNKSERIRAGLDHKRTLLHERKLTAKCPAWMSLQDGKFVLDEKAAEAIRYIFQLALDGYGHRQILGAIAGWPAIGRSKAWNSSYIQRILSDRSTIGEYTPHKLNDKGERVPAGEPIPHYYPPVIDEGTFYRAQKAKQVRKHQKGRSSEWVNLFTGLVYFCDGAKAHVTTSRKQGKIQRRLASSDHVNKKKKACPYTVLYPRLENALLWSLSEITHADLAPTNVESPVDEIDARERELEALTGRLAELEERLLDPSRSLATIERAAAKLEKRKEQVENELEDLKATTHTNGVDPLAALKKLGLTHELAHQITLSHDAAYPMEMERETRLKLRAVIPQLVERIELHPSKDKKTRKISCRAVITYHNGNTKEIDF